MAVLLQEVVAHCDKRMGYRKDFQEAFNGLQFANSGTVHKIGAAVDAGYYPFQKALALGIDFLIVHHGLFWQNPLPITGVTFAKYKLLWEGNCAIYSSHLPLDAHPEIGNNAQIAKALKLTVIGGLLSPFEREDPIGTIAMYRGNRSSLRKSLETLFPVNVTALEYGSESPRKIGILSGSGTAGVEVLIKNDIDTFITGELREQHFNFAQEHQLNFYLCGHYATETFGVKALAQEVAKQFEIPWEFIPMDCPL